MWAQLPSGCAALARCADELLRLLPKLRRYTAAPFLTQLRSEGGSDAEDKQSYRARAATDLREERKSLRAYSLG